MKILRNLFLCFAVLLLFSCGGVDNLTYPEGLIESLWFTGEIIDTKKENIRSKEELIDYISTYKDYAMQMGIPSDYSRELNHPSTYYVVYVTPLCENKPVLSTAEYKSGMPINVENFGSSYDYSVGGFNSREFVGICRSTQNVVLVKGNPEYWADSAFAYNDKFYTILPVCSESDDDNSKLDFTYTIKKL
jgi:hypothetical protein